jgi:hypothetical protein
MMESREGREGRREGGEIEGSILINADDDKLIRLYAQYVSQSPSIEHTME